MQAIYVGIGIPFQVLATFLLALVPAPAFNPAAPGKHSAVSTYAHVNGYHCSSCQVSLPSAYTSFRSRRGTASMAFSDEARIHSQLSAGTGRTSDSRGRIGRGCEYSRSCTEGLARSDEVTKFSASSSAGTSSAEVRSTPSGNISESPMIFNDVVKTSSTHALIVPGGGLDAKGKPSVWVRRRLAEAAHIYKTRSAAGQPCVIVAVGAGTIRAPMPIDPHSDFHVFEAESSARCLIHDYGVAAEHVFEENWSLDTVGNAYMLRTMHTDVAGWKHLVVVNNEFHMRRTRAIFEKVFNLDPPPHFGGYYLEFVEVPNDGVEHAALIVRKKREVRSLKRFVENTSKIKTMREMHEFLFSEHKAYASKRLLKERKPATYAESFKTYMG